MLDTVKVFAKELDRYLTETCSDHMWETEPLPILLDDLDESVADLYASIKDFGGCPDIDPNVRKKCLESASLIMMIFSQIHPLTRCNRCGKSIHAMPRMASQERG